MRMLKYISYGSMSGIILLYHPLYSKMIDVLALVPQYIVTKF